MSGSNPYVDGVVNAVMWVACFFTVLMMAHVTLDVFLRVVFNSPITGTFEVASNYYMVSVMYLPLAYVSRNDGQIIVELFTRGLGERKLLRWDIVVNLVTVAYTAIFAIYTGMMAIEQTRTGELKEMGDGFLDIWPARWLLPVAFGLMAIYLAGRVRHDVRRARGRSVPISG